MAMKLFICSLLLASELVHSEYVGDRPNRHHADQKDHQAHGAHHAANKIDPAPVEDNKPNAASSPSASGAPSGSGAAVGSGASSAASSSSNAASSASGSGAPSGSGAAVGSGASGGASSSSSAADASKGSGKGSGKGKGSGSGKGKGKGKGEDEDPLITLIKQHQGEIDFKLTLASRADEEEDAVKDFKMAEWVQSQGNQTDADGACEDKLGNCEELTEKGTNCEGETEETGNTIAEDCCRSCKGSAAQGFGSGSGSAAGAGASSGALDDPASSTASPGASSAAGSGGPALLQAAGSSSNSSASSNDELQSMPGSGISNDEAILGTQSEQANPLVRLVSDHVGPIRIKITLKDVEVGLLEMLEAGGASEVAKISAAGVQQAFNAHSA